MIEFRAAMDELCLSVAEAAELFGVSAQHVKQMRLDRDNAGRRPPPPGWELKFAQMLQRKSKQLAATAASLEKQAASS